VFGWLTRNDGAKKSRLKRRLKSPRGSVFSEFAIVMPIVLLMCSAVFELVGFWDAQIMANHAAWQVGRIASVRGDDGMAFSDAVTKISKTGVISEKMPQAIQNILKPLVTSIGGTINKFNDRGVITTMFLMSTCEIGYYGSSPGTALADAVDTLISKTIEGITKSIEESVSALADVNFDWLPGSSSDVIRNLISKILNKLINVALKPIFEKIGSALSEAVKKFVALIDLDKLFSGGSAAARRARQIYGAAARVALAANPVSSVTELNKDPYVFGNPDYSKQGRLAYPLVVDKDAKSDGYFVTGAHGWPPNNQALRLLKVEVKWPYSRGWVFPVVAGYGKKSAPVAKGTSIAFPQPNIVDKNLWSTGAVAYAEGDFTNKMSNAYEEVAKAMKSYLALAKFGMEYRLRKESIWLVDEQPEWYHSGSAKHCSPLYELFDKNKGGDYANCWGGITDWKSQNAYMRELEDYFKTDSYRSRNYFFWEGSWHNRYASDLVSWRGRAHYYGLALSVRFKSSSAVWYFANSSTRGYSGYYYEQFLNHVGQRVTDVVRAGLDPKDMWNAYDAFQRSVGGFKLKDIVLWKDPSRYQDWYSTDVRVQQVVDEKADKRFGTIMDLLNAEIADIQKVLDNKMDDYTGDTGDSFIIDPDDEEAIDNPQEAARKAMEKWEARKAELRQLLREIDEKITALNNAWWAYDNAAAQLLSNREQTVDYDVSEAFISACILEKRAKAFTTQEFASILRGNNLIPYDIVGKTAEFARLMDAYCDALQAMWDAELSYGVKLGLASAKKAKKTGKSIDDLDFGKDVLPDGEGGSFNPGSDKGWPINKDDETWSSSGGWQ